MGEPGFGKSVGLLSDPSLRYIIKIFDLYTWRTGFLEQWPKLWFLGLDKLLNLLRHFSPLSRNFCA